MPLFALPALIWNAHYVLVFKLLMTACGVGFVALLGLDRCAGSSSAAWRLVPIVLAPVLMGPVFLNRYDPLAGAARLARARAAACAAHERHRSALLGVGTALKIYPAVFVPIAAAARALAAPGRARRT